MTKIIRRVIGNDPQRDPTLIALQESEDRRLAQIAAERQQAADLAAAQRAALDATAANQAAAAETERQRQAQIAAEQAAAAKAEAKSRAEQEDADRIRRGVRAKGGRRGLLTFAETGMAGLSAFLGGGR